LPGGEEQSAASSQLPAAGFRLPAAGAATAGSIRAIRRSGVSGRRVTSAPVAWATALKIAGAGPSIGSSPMPLAPAGPCGYGTSSKNTRMGGRSIDVGMM